MPLPIPRAFAVRNPLLRPSLCISTIRSIHLSSSPTLRYASKDPLMDKDALNPQSTQYSKSGSDDDAAHDDAAFDPNITTPEAQLSKSGGAAPADDPLNVSPANSEVSQPRSGTEGGAEHGTSEGRARTSGAGSPKKAGGDKSG